MKNEIVKFINDGLQLEVMVSPEIDTVWLTQKQMESLFDVKHATVSEHINNILASKELDKTSVGYSDKSSGGRKPKVYNLDMIISVGYRVNSRKGIIFRKWATSILKDYMIKGYAINQRRLEALNKTVEIQTRMLASALNIEEDDVLRAINLYTDGLTLLDDYDHQKLTKPSGNKSTYVLTYKECRNLIDKMSKEFDSAVFGIEKEKGRLEGIIASIYQSAFGEEVYSSIEEKAANLLYFLIKDHPFVDGCKRVGASIFLYFLEKNNRLIIDNKQIISSSVLVAITLMTAESRPNEKDIIVKLIMNFLVNGN